jgi:hypothetical protein
MPLSVRPQTLASVMLTGRNAYTRYELAAISCSSDRNHALIAAYDSELNDLLETSRSIIASLNIQVVALIGLLTGGSDRVRTG